VIRTSIDLIIDRPVNEVFTFLTDAANHPRWDRSSVAMEPQEPGPWHSGLTFREVRRIGPRTREMRSMLMALKPQHMMELRSLTGPPFQGHWRFSSAGSGTRFQWTGEMRLTGAMRLVAPVIARSFRASAKANVARLRHVLEHDPAAGERGPSAP
jgi:hypothetical protein